MSHSPINRMLKLANKYKIDSFVNSLYEFISNLKLYHIKIIIIYRNKFVY